MSGLRNKMSRFSEADNVKFDELYIVPASAYRTRHPLCRRMLLKVLTKTAKEMGKRDLVASKEVANTIR